MKKIKVDKIYRNETKQDGSKYVSKAGKEFKYVTIMTTGTDGTQYKLSNCDYDDWTASIEEGQMVLVTIEKNGEYLNFSKPTKVDMLESVVTDLSKRVEALEAGPGNPITISTSNQPMGVDVSQPSVSGGSVTATGYAKSSNIPDGEEVPMPEPPPEQEDPEPPIDDLPF